MDAREANDFPLPPELDRLTPADVFDSLGRAGIHLTTAEEDRLAKVMRRTMEANREWFRECRRRISLNPRSLRVDALLAGRA